MTEAAPRGQMGPGPATMPAISWYEFVLNEKLLDQHLAQDKPGTQSPSCCGEILVLILELNKCYKIY